MKHLWPSLQLPSRRGCARSLVLAACLGTTVPSFATNYYVALYGSNSNNGLSVNTPFMSLTFAMSRVKPGDNVYMRGGNYKYTAVQYLKNAGTSAAQTLTIAPYANEAVTLDGSTLPSGDVLAITGSYITVDRINVVNSPHHGISIWGADHITVKNLLVSKTALSSVYAGYTSPGKVNNITVDNVEARYASGAASATVAWIPSIMTENASSVKINNCRIHNNWGEGVGLRCTTQTSVTNNQVWDCFSVKIYLDNAADVNIEGNFCYSTWDTRYYRNGGPSNGIQLACETVPSTSRQVVLTNITVQNNVITHCGVPFVYANYELGGGLHNCTVTRNTFVNPVYRQLTIEPNAAHVGNLITANVFQSPAAATSLAVGYGLKGVTITGNCWYGSLLALIPDSNPLLANPLIVQPGSSLRSDNEMLATSPARLQGLGAIPLPGV